MGARVRVRRVLHLLRLGAGAPVLFVCSGLAVLLELSARQLRRLCCVSVGHDWRTYQAVNLHRGHRAKSSPGICRRCGAQGVLQLQP